MWKNEIKKSRKVFTFETPNVDFVKLYKIGDMRDRKVTVVWNLEFGIRDTMFRDMGVRVNKIVFDDGTELDISQEEIDGPDDIFHVKVSPVEVIKYERGNIDIIWSH